MSVPRLSNVAGLTGVPLDEVAIAIAGELGPVDAAATRARFDALSGELERLTRLDPTRRIEVLLSRLGEEEGFGVGAEDRAEGLLIDHVVAARRGHPLALAVLYAGVARRCGLALYPVGNERTLLLGDPGADPPIAIDPVPGGRRPPATMRWLCPHLVGAMLLGGLAARLRKSGELDRALRALELRLVLPLGPDLRRRHEHQLRALRATLN